MKFIPTYLLVLLVAITACQSEQTSDTTVAENNTTLPKLLDRPDALQQGKEWEKVQNLYVKHRNAIQESTDNAADRLALAQVYIHEARVTGEHGHYYPAALEVLQGISDEHPDKDIRFRKLATRAGVELSLHDFNKGLASAKAAVEINPYNAQVYGALVDAYVELGQYDQAVAMADKMVSIRPDLRSYARVSYLREIHGDVDGALSAMEMAVQAGYPGNEETAWARLTLAEMYQKYRTPEAAEAQYQQILRERPDYPFAIAALGDIAAERGNYDKAEELLKEAAAIIPEFGFYESLAQVYRATGRDQLFKETLAELWVMLQEDTDSGHNMTLEYANLHQDLSEDYDKALGYAMEEYQKRPDNIDVNLALASIYNSQGKVAEAEKHLAVAARTNAQYPTIKALQQQLAMK